jgi:hypothetical protein
MNAIDWPQLPDMGVYLTWPELGIEAIHPDDRELAESLIPSDRVFRRVSFDGEYYRVEYHEKSFRIRPTLWLQVSDEGLRIGNQVEVLGAFLQAEPMIATISEMHYSQTRGAIQYTLDHHEMPFPRPFLADELRLLTTHETLKPSDADSPPPKVEESGTKIE